MTRRDYTLNEVAERLGVHYMTAYRYVRTGRLVARQRGSQWLVNGDELVRFERSGRSDTGPVVPPTPHSRQSAVERLAARLIAGDEGGSWLIVEELQVGGASPRVVYLELFGPAMRKIGERWAAGVITVADEHRASVVMHRLVGRMGPQFRRRGPRIGAIVVGAPSGELHGLPVALAADLLRSAGFEVIDLGADVPAEAFVASAQAVDDLAAVAISVTAKSHRLSAAAAVHALRESGVSAPIVIGGAAVNSKDAPDLGADCWVPDIDSFVRFIRTH